MRSFLRGWTAAFVVTVFATMLLAGCDGLLSAERRIERAQQSYDSGEYAKAMEDVKTALDAEPDNASGRVLLSRIALKLGDPTTARKELDRAVEAGADPASVRELHYAIFLVQGRYDDALIAAAVDQDLPALRRLVIMATAEIGLGKYEEAEKSIRQALALDPNDREANLTQARLYWATGKLQEAQDTLDTVLQRDPDYAQAWLLKGRLALGIGDAEHAREAFEKARDNATLQLDFPDQVAVYVGLVESRIAVGDLEGADVELKALQARAPNAFVTRYLKARVAFVKGENGAAAAELQRALSQQPDSVPARLLLGAALLGDGAVEQAEAELNRLVSDHPDNIEARKLLARLYLSRNDTESASRVLAEGRTTMAADAGADWLEGATLLLSGKTSEAIALLEQGAATDPGNYPLKLDLAQAYLAAGRRDDALSLLQSIPAGEGGARRSRLVVLAEVAGLSLADARPRILRLAAESQGDAGLLSVAGSYLLSAGDAEGAGKLFEQALATDPKQVDARLGLASLAIQSRDAARASEQLRSVLEIDPTNERAHLGLVFVALIQGDRPGARNWLERAISANPSVVESRLRLAEMALADGDPIRAKAMVDQALAVTRARPETLNRIGQIYLGASQYDDALARFNEASALGFRDADLSVGVALIALGRKDEARARLEAAASDRPDWAAPMISLAALDAGDGRFDQALKRVDAFEKAGGPRFVADQIRGDVLLVAGRPGEALAAYQRASTARPSSALIVKIYGASRAAGRANPEASLTAWLEKNPQDQVVRVVLAEHFQRAGERSSAITQYETVMQAGPSAAVMNNLAWLYFEEGDGRAEDLARRAHEAAPADPEIADTYGWILVEKGDAKAGLPILEAAVKGRPQHPEIRYHYAAALARDGQVKPAAEALRKLLADTKDFPSRAAAQALLDELGRKELGL